jgi:RNA polymerase sigma factor (sigma-70 family)
MAQSASDRVSSHDLDLVALATAGDRKAFGELVRRHGSAVRSLLRRMGADSALSDDLAQDAFLSAFEQIGDFRGEGTFQNWVKRIAARLCVKRWRRDARLDLMAAPPEQGAEIGSGDTGAINRIDLDEALRGLSPVERVCVSLCYGGGLSHGEAAAALNAPLGTVKSHVKRGLEKLRARMAPEQARGTSESTGNG